MDAGPPRLRIRAGDKSDAASVLAMWDRAVSWLVDRGQPMQWGTQPPSTHPRTVDLTREWSESSGLYVAEIDDQVVGASVVVPRAPDYVPPTTRRETYLLFLISDRNQAGRSIGSHLVRASAAHARGAGSELLRVDCWAGAPRLISWYEEQGFVPSARYTVDVRGGWTGQIFEMDLTVE